MSEAVDELATRTKRTTGDLVAVGADTFTYAESYDERAARYCGLHPGELVNVTADDTGLLVRPK
jgi:hypothetical protein